MEACGPWKHLLARRGYVELVPVVVDFPQTMRPAQLMPLEASVGPTCFRGTGTSGCMRVLVKGKRIKLSDLSSLSPYGSGL